jgi:hypothetical protein
MAVVAVLNTVLQADTSHYDRGMDKAGKGAAKLRSDVQASSGGLEKALAGMVATGMVAMGVAAVSAGVALHTLASRGAEAIISLGHLSRELGLTAVAMAGLEKFGGGGEGFAHFMTHLQHSVENTSPQIEQAFARMGLTAAQFKGPNQDWAANLRLIADGYSRIRTQSERVATIRAIGGRGGIEMMDDLARGSAGIDAMTARAERFGLTFSDSQAEALKDANREWAGFGMAIEGIGRQAAVMFTPAWEAIGKVGSAIGEWIVGAFRQAQPYMEKFIESATTMWGPLWEGIQNVGEALGEIFIASFPLIEQFGELFMTVIRSIFSMFPYNGMVEEIMGDGSVITMIADAIKAIIPWVKIVLEVWTTMFQAIGDIARALWGAVWQGIKMVGGAIAVAFNTSGIVSWFRTATIGGTNLKDMLVGGLAVVAVAMRNIGRTWDLVMTGITLKWLEFIQGMTIGVKIAKAPQFIQDMFPGIDPNELDRLRRILTEKMDDFGADVRAQIEKWNFELGGGLLDAARAARAVLADVKIGIDLGQMKAITGVEATLAGSERAFSLLYGGRGTQDYYSKLTAQATEKSRDELAHIRAAMDRAPAIMRARM